MNTITITIEQFNAKFIFELVKSGVGFNATQDGENMIITLTGGY